ncbi:MAG: hypothetical protein K6T85_15115 [Gorillibacterium sp.]|nr:hypothetical protein [Gorillibacterium sp.]
MILNYVDRHGTLQEITFVNNLGILDLGNFVDAINSSIFTVTSDQTIQFNPHSSHVTDNGVVACRNPFISREYSYVLK